MLKFSSFGCRVPLMPWISLQTVMGLAPSVAFAIGLIVVNTIFILAPTFSPSIICPPPRILLLLALSTSSEFSYQLPVELFCFTSVFSLHHHRKHQLQLSSVASLYSSWFTLQWTIALASFVQVNETLSHLPNNLI